MRRKVLLVVFCSGILSAIAEAGTYTLTGAAQYTPLPTIGEWGVFVLSALFMLSGAYFAAKKEYPVSLAMIFAALGCFPFLV